jgi:hypothetical protein
MILVLRVLIVLMLACLPVRAEEEMEFDIDIDTRLVCDTQKQVERFVSLFAGDVGAALHAVNSEQESPTACDITTIAYVPGDDVATAKGPCGHFRVVKILLIGVLTEDEGFLFTVPAPYFTMLPAGQNISRLRGRLDELPKHASAVPSATECSLEKHRKDEPGR